MNTLTIALFIGFGLIITGLLIYLVAALHSLNSQHQSLERLSMQNELLVQSVNSYLDKDIVADQQQQQRFFDLTRLISAENQNFQQKQSDQFILFTDKLRTLQLSIHEQLTANSTRLAQTMTTEFKGLSDSLEIRLSRIDQKVMDNLQQGFDKTNQTFTNILERLSKIDEAQRKIDALSTEIVSLQDVLTDKKSRGTFGEVQLYQILSAVFGEKNDRIYQMQYSFSTSVRADAVLFTPEPLGTIAIDSKFPLENYRRMMDKSLSATDQSSAEKLFVSDCKKHIDAIAGKYIIPGITADQAFLFLPAEAVFATIHAYHPEIIEYASKRNVWITSPTTLMSTLTTIQTILINIERNKYTQVIQEQLSGLNVEFSRYRTRWDALSKHIETVSKDVMDIHTTTEKITRRFESIAAVENLPKESTKD